MCGIAGALRFDHRSIIDLRDLVAGMTGSMTHRGPDDEGLWLTRDNRLALGHRRLSIVDLSPLGRNPMLWDDGRLAITFNGEIYNYRELRHELEQEGYTFRSRTDTEVILAAYDRWDVAAVSRFVGMFAFGLWDSPRQRLWLARDRFGKKPLYYAEQDGTLRFASELKAIVADPAYPRRIDQTALQLYLRFGYVPAPYSIFQGARKLEPGHQLVWENQRRSITRYWDARDHARPGRDLTEQEAEQRLEALLGTAVEQRMIADVPLGAFLSGGIDSSLVVALMQERSAERVKTFTIRFDDPAYNEADFAAAVARHIGTDHYEESCTGSQMLAALDQVSETLDEPFADSSVVPTYLVSKIARQHVTVALSGDGGDELFFGYPRYRYYATGAWVFGLPAGVRRLVARTARAVPHRRVKRVSEVLTGTDADLYGRFISWQTREEVAALTGQPAADAPIYSDILATSWTLPRETRAPLLDVVSYLPDDILTKVDRASMAVSLEIRAPLLDHRVAELALALPHRLKCRRGATKWILRQLLYKRVPRHLVERPKMGFGVPLRDWLTGPLRGRMDDFCASSTFEDLGLDAPRVRAMWTDFKGGRRYRPDLVWQMFMLGVWSRRFLRCEDRTAALAL